MLKRLSSWHRLRWRLVLFLTGAREKGGYLESRRPLTEQEVERIKQRWVERYGGSGQ
jgi:hypothetical protein